MTTQTQTSIQRAIDLGREDGLSTAAEAIEGGYYGKASDWDSGLLNAIGCDGVAELFGVEVDSEEYHECLAAYSAAAQQAWIEAGKQQN